MGAYPGVVEEVGEGDAGDVQCARGIRRRQTNVPHGLPETALHHSSQRRFYEWTGEKGDKQPHLFMAADGSPVLAFAGLWDRWRYNGEDILSCTIIVRAANRWMATYHDRMPVILDDVASVLSNDSNLVAPIRIGQSGAEQTGRSFVAGKQSQLGTVARGRIHPPPSRQRSCRFAISRFSAPLRRTGLGEAGDLEVAPARHPNVRPSTDQPFRAWAADHELFVIDAEVAKRVIVRVSAMVSRTQGELARNSECYRAIDGA
jgi:SOS response associated peptidase (SRAP)